MNAFYPRLLAGPAALGAALLLGCVCPAALAADGPGDPAAYHDLRHTMQARSALLADPVLAPLNLGVRVHNRVAVLWGPVPTAGLKERAELLLRKLPDLLEVRNELHVEQPEPPPQYLPGKLPPATPVPLPGFSGAADTWQDLFARRQDSAPAFASPAENVRLKPAPSGLPGDGGAVLPAIAVPGPAGSPLDQAVARLQRDEPRFRGLRADVRGQQVRLSGTAATWQDVYDLADVLTRLPGVDRVVLEQIRTAAAGR